MSPIERILCRELDLLTHREMGRFTLAALRLLIRIGGISFRGPADLGSAIAIFQEIHGRATVTVDPLVVQYFLVSILVRDGHHHVVTSRVSNVNIDRLRQGQDSSVPM